MNEQTDTSRTVRVSGNVHFLTQVVAGAYNMTMGEVIEHALVLYIREQPINLLEYLEQSLDAINKPESEANNDEG